jgi:hypothetical protein
MQASVYGKAVNRTGLEVTLERSNIASLSLEAIKGEGPRVRVNKTA